jgi:hypothetical protein
VSFIECKLFRITTAKFSRATQRSTAIFFYSDCHDGDYISLKSSRNIVSAFSVPLKYAKPLWNKKYSKTQTVLQI